MFTRNFHPDQFLRLVYGTEPFVEYCDSRGIAFPQNLENPMRDKDYQRWTKALSNLPKDQAARVELELTSVNEMAAPETIALLVAVSPDRSLPPDRIPGDTALALWFLVHYPDLFHEVFLNQEIQVVDSWRHARVQPGIHLDDLESKRSVLASSLKEFFRVREGTGRFCTVHAYRLKPAYCFVAHLADRLQLFDGFTENGEHVAQHLRRAFPVIFVYYPDDGTVLLKARQRAAHRILELYQRFGQSVLGLKLDERSLSPVFRLDLFKQRFDPVPDAGDMVRVRVKAVGLAYPERHSRRRVNLETLASDEQFAILELLQTHGGSDAVLEQLEVQYAELQVTLLVEGRDKGYLIRLWPNRSSLNQTVLGERLRTCLKKWGIYHAR